MIRALAGLLVALLFAGCGGPAEPVWEPDAAVEKVRYRHGGAPTLTLFTVFTTRSGSGAHAALMVNGDERLLFDPAGTFKVSIVAERNDVLHGMTPRAVAAYIDYHARPTHDVLVQEVRVTPEQARAVSRLIQTNGAVAKAQCALSIGKILSQVPGFQNVVPTYFPKNLAEAFAARPGVTTRIVTNETVDASHNVTFVRPAAAR